MKGQNEATFAKSLFDISNILEEAREKNYSILKMQQCLGQEPWDCDIVLKLYMKNFINMEKILKKHAGYEIYLEISKIKNLLLKLSMFKKSIEAEINKCNNDYFHKEHTDSMHGNRILTDYQNTINLYFYGYVSLCYTIIEYEKIIEKKYTHLKKKFSLLFDKYLDNPCHRCIMLIRNKLNHGVIFEFKWSVNFDLRL